jgi:hypothetical protein
METFWKDMADELTLWANSIGTGEDAPEIASRELSAWLRSRLDIGDEACLLWIHSRCWPEWTPELRWEIGLRLSWAIQLCLLLSLSPMHPPLREQALEWLLLDCWRVAGPDRAQDLAGGRLSPES